VTSSRELIDVYKQRLFRYGFSAQTLLYRTEDQHAAKLRAAGDALAGHVREGESLLDVGCGFGKLLEFYAPRGPYLGIDLVEEFVLEARRRFPDGIFLVGDVVDSARRADWISLVGVLSSVPDPERLLRHCLQRVGRGAVFDVTVARRLPPSFKLLNRFKCAAIRQLVGKDGLLVSEELDGGRSWRLFVVERCQIGKVGADSRE